MIEYRQIPNHPGYRFGSDGSIWTRLERRYAPMLCYVCGDQWRQLFPARSRQGYRVTALAGSRKKTRRLHCLILEAFIGPRPSGMVGRHLDDDKDNNVIANLAWGTSVENSQDAVRNGRMGRKTPYLGPRGERHGNAQLTDAQVKEIAAIPRKGNTNAAVAKRFGVSVSTVEKIRVGKYKR